MTSRLTTSPLRGLLPALAVTALLVLALPGGGSAQERGDTVPLPDSVAAAQDTTDTIDYHRRLIVERLFQLPDSLRFPGSLELPEDLLAEVREEVREEVQEQEALQEARDSLGEEAVVVRDFPSLHAGAPTGFATGVWTWDREALLSTPALSLAELLDEVPGVVPVRGGDYGTPGGLSAFALGGGGVRVVWDGFEMLPMDGGIPDLARIGLGGLESVRLERGMGELRIELESLRAHDPRAMSVVEAGTGDLDTNFFRGTFVTPEALGGSLGFSLERLDTRGSRGRQPGSLLGGWLRYTLHRGDDAGLRFEYRRGTAETAIEDVPFPPKATRSDWVIRGRTRLAEGLVAEAYTGSSSVEGGGGEDDGLTPLDADRRQHGVRASLERGPFWSRGAFRLLEGPDLPSTSLDLEVGGALPGVGGASAGWRRDAWEGRGTALTSLRAWTAPLLGLSAFASLETGERGSRVFGPREPLPEEPEEPEDGSEEGTGDGTGGGTGGTSGTGSTGSQEGQDGEEPEEELPAARFTDRTALRLGASFDWRALALSGAWLREETDSLLPLYFLGDRDGVVIPGGERTGFEVAGRLGLPVDGFALYGSLQQWDQETRYLPERIYEGGLDFHDTFFPTENLEIRGRLGVQGRTSMLVPFRASDDGEGGEGGEEVGEAQDGQEGDADLLRVPFRQSWNAYLQIRVLTVRLFIRWENFTVRDRNQDLPDLLQPRTRAMYGIRWTLWN